MSSTPGEGLEESSIEGPIHQWTMGRRSRAVAWLSPTWMGRDLKVVMVARLSMSAARALATVVVPLYLATKGYSGLRLGELFFAAAAVSLVLSTAIGVAADRVGRKPFLVVVPFLVTGAGLIFALVTSSWVLFAAGALGGVGRGAGAGAGVVGPYQPAESALVTDSVHARWRNDAFGRLAFMSGLGALAGGLLAIIFAPQHPSARAALAAYRPSFVVLAILGAVAGLVALWLLEPGRAQPSTALADNATSSPDPPVSRRRIARGTSWFPRRSLPLLLRLWAANSVNGFAIGMFGPFVTYWL